LVASTFNGPGRRDFWLAGRSRPVADQIARKAAETLFQD